MYRGGYTGKILRINLTEQTAKKEKLPLKVAKDFIGGAGFGIKYLYDEVKAGTDPLGPENKLFFAPGPFSGTSVPCASRIAVTGKSPLTNAVGMCLSGGFFPSELKLAGYDMLIIEGKAEAVAIASMLHYEFISKNEINGEYKKEGGTHEKIRKIWFDPFPGSDIRFQRHLCPG